MQRPAVSAARASTKSSSAKGAKAPEKPGRGAARGGSRPSTIRPAAKTPPATARKAPSARPAAKPSKAPAKATKATGQSNGKSATVRPIAAARTVREQAAKTNGAAHRPAAEARKATSEARPATPPPPPPRMPQAAAPPLRAAIPPPPPLPRGTIPPAPPPAAPRNPAFHKAETLPAPPEAGRLSSFPPPRPTGRPGGPPFLRSPSARPPYYDDMGPPVLPPTVPVNFEVGDKCVHPAHGVGEVTAVEKRELGGSTGTFYVLRILDNGMKVMVPTAAAAQVGLREIMSAKDADSILDTMRAREVAVDVQPWSRRFRIYTEMIKSKSPTEVAKVLRDMHRLKFDKDLSFGERRLLDQAKSLLMKELSLAKRLTEAQLEAEVQAIFAN